MKYVLTVVSFFWVFIFCFSCVQSGGKEVNEPTKVYTRYNTVIIDSCEYIEYDNGIFDQRVYSLSHKGNCKNHKK